MTTAGDPRRVPRPPWKVPDGRALSFWAAFAQVGLPILIVVFAVNPWFPDYPPDPVRIAVGCVGALSVLYGLLVIAIPRRRRFTLAWIRDSGSRAPAVLFGTAWILPPIVGRGIPFLFSAAPWELLYWLPAVAIMLWCMCSLGARVSSDRAAKRTILAGKARNFVLSTDRARWWDVDHWVHSRQAAPPDALHSPDGNYWWAGSAWLPMPPGRRTRNNLSSHRRPGVVA